MTTYLTIDTSASVAVGVADWTLGEVRQLSWATSPGEAAPCGIVGSDGA